MPSTQTVNKRNNNKKLLQQTYQRVDGVSDALLDLCLLSTINHHDIRAALITEKKFLKSVLSLKAEDLPADGNELRGLVSEKLAAGQGLYNLLLSLWYENNYVTLFTKHSDIWPLIDPRTDTQTIFDCAQKTINQEKISFHEIVNLFRFYNPPQFHPVVELLKEFLPDDLIALKTLEGSTVNPDTDTDEPGPPVHLALKGTTSNPDKDIEPRPSEHQLALKGGSTLLNPNKVTNEPRPSVHELKNELIRDEEERVIDDQYQESVEKMIDDKGIDFVLDALQIFKNKHNNKNLTQKVVKEKQDQIITLTESNKELKKTLEAQTAQFNDLKEQFEQARRNFEKDKERLSKKLTNELATFYESNHAKQIETLNKKLSDAEKARSNSEKDKEQLSKKLTNELATFYDNKYAQEIVTLNNKLSELQNAPKNEQDYLAQVERVKEEAEERSRLQIYQLKEQIRSLESSHEEEIQRITRLYATQNVDDKAESLQDSKNVSGIGFVGSIQDVKTNSTIETKEELIEEDSLFELLEFRPTTEN